jgi:hypothetical protein
MKNKKKNKNPFVTKSDWQGYNANRRNKRKKKKQEKKQYK